jgi:NAD-dependent DNA ligase/predicted flap endonuclease-1-like 5' DNA nuclease
MADAGAPKDLRLGFVDMLGRLEQLMRAKGEIFRAQAYKKAQEELLGGTTPITDAKQLEGLPGIGATMIKKFDEYAKTGQLKALMKPGDQAWLNLTGVHGIGPKKAKQLIDAGITTIPELRKAAEADPGLLSSKQQTGLARYEDLQERIPREEIQRFEVSISEAWNKVVPPGDNEAKMLIVGSYRRGAANSGDIDVIITSGAGDPGIHKRFVKELQSSGVLTDVLSTGKTKTLAIGKLPGDGKFRRIDIMYSPPDEYSFAVLYFTGSRSFNIAMRNRALAMGYSLSEHGLIDMASKGKIEEPMKTEADIFKFLGMKFKEPVERTGVLAVQAAEGAAPVGRDTVKAKKDAKKKSVTVRRKEQPRIGDVGEAATPKKATVAAKTPAATAATPKKATVVPKTPAATAATPKKATVVPKTPAATAATPKQATVAAKTPAATPKKAAVVPKTPAATPKQATVAAKTPAATPKKATVAAKTPAATAATPKQATVAAKTPAATPKQATVVPKTQKKKVRIVESEAKARKLQMLPPPPPQNTPESPTPEELPPAPIMLAKSPDEPPQPLQLASPSTPSPDVRVPAFVQSWDDRELERRFKHVGIPAAKVTKDNRRTLEQQYTKVLTQKFLEDKEKAEQEFDPELTVGQAVRMQSPTPPEEEKPAIEPPSALPPSPIPLASPTPEEATPAKSVAAKTPAIATPKSTVTPESKTPKSVKTVKRSKTVKAKTPKPAPSVQPTVTAAASAAPAAEEQSATLSGRKEQPRVEVEEATPAAAPAKAAERKTVQKSKKPTMKQNLTRFAAEGVKALESMDQRALEMMHRKANKAYRQGDAIMTDTAFDELDDYLKDKFPTSKVFEVVGAKTKRVEVPLPYTLFSMNKIKPGQGKLEAWKKKYTGPYVTSAKLDGASALYIVQPGGARLLTHGEVRKGDTTQKGGDVSHLLAQMGMATNTQFMLPDQRQAILGPSGTFMIRGEIVLDRKTFAEKYSDTYANPRNMVAGLINALDAAKHGERQKDLKFVAFEVIEPQGLKPSQQFKLLEPYARQLGIEVVEHAEVATPAELTEELLSKEFVRYREEHPYECDGVIVVDDKVYPRKNQNPDHAIAFKMIVEDQKAEATIRDISWRVSKDGYIKPTVHVHPVKVPGATIRKITGHDARTIQTKKLGPGAKVVILRRGDVIPHVENVKTPATAAAMKEAWWQGPYEWSKSGVDIRLPAEAMLDEQWNTEMRFANIKKFFDTIKASNLGEKAMRKMFEEGYDTVEKMAAVTPQELTRIEGFKATKAKNIVEGIRNAVRDASELKLMVGSNVFGRGSGRDILAKVLKKFPNVLHFESENMTENQKLERGIAAIKGVSEERALQIVAALPKFRRFLKPLRPELVTPFPVERALSGEKLGPRGSPIAAAAGTPGASTAPQIPNHPLAGKEVVTTGIKVNLVEPHLAKAGASLGSGVKASTAVVVVSDDPLYSSSKTEKAKKLNIPMMTVEEFKSKYFPE